MAIRVTNGFDVRAKQPIDTRILLTKAEMLAINEKLMPQNYFCICKDDGKLYIYNSTFESLETTGKFRSYEEVMNIADAINKAIESEPTKAAIEQAVAKTIPGAMKATLEDDVLGPQLVENMFSDEHFDINVQKKIDLSISVISAIDGND